MDVININNYIFDKPLTSDNSGFSKWGIGQRANRSYFVKEFLSPVYPCSDAMFTEEKKAERIKLCKKYVDEKLELYEAIRRASDGNLVVPEQFFRSGAKYYISTEAITGPYLSLFDISHHPFIDRLRLCCSVAHAIAGLHAQNIIHADIKPDNILVVYRGFLQAKVIDFDCSFFEKDKPKLGEELNGDLVYLSPESFLHIAEVESNLSAKMDVFALGILFHQYLTGGLPRFDTNEYQYVYEAVLDGAELDFSAVINRECSDIIKRMLEKEPENRPTIQEVFGELNGILLGMLNRSQPKDITVKDDTSGSDSAEGGEDTSALAVDIPVNSETGRPEVVKVDDFFSTAGDL